MCRCRSRNRRKFLALRFGARTGQDAAGSALTGSSNYSKQQGNRYAVFEHITGGLIHMKKALFVLLAIFAVTGFAMAQITTTNTDVLGAHLNYGRGCAACHAPHSGAYGNGNAKTNDPTAGNIALWGEDVGSLYGKTITTGQSEHGTAIEVLPTSL